MYNLGCSIEFRLESLLLQQEILTQCTTTYLNYLTENEKMADLKVIFGLRNKVDKKVLAIFYWRKIESADTCA